MSSRSAPKRRSFAGRRPEATIAWVREFIQELSRSRVTGMAAEMSFWLFLSLVPLAAVAGLVVAKVAVSSAELATLLASLPHETRELISKQLNEVAAWNGGSVGLSAIVVFVWLASGGVHATFDVLEVKAGTPRPWWKKRALAIATCLALSVGTAVIALVATGLSNILDLMRGTIPVAVESSTGFGGFLATGLRVVIGAGTALGLVSGLYFVGVPRSARRETPVLPGAILAVVLQGTLGYGYVFYLSKAGTGSAYQASLSIIAVTLMALYLFSVALLIGAELNHTFAKHKRQNTR